jgi:hypothetical protein
MSKVIQSPVARYPGSVTLPDYYLFDRLIAWEDAYDQAAAAEGVRKANEIAKAVLPMVDEWHITGIDEHPTQLPATPKVAVIELLTWLLGEITQVIRGEDDSPLSVGASSNTLPETESAPQS